jgi:translation initiation factor 2B subunit (eIF-2B alpha/beta/delta family)/isopentenyldiphosphate isomerase
MEETHVVTCFLRNRGEVLLLRRSEEVGSYPGLWGGVSGHVEAEADDAGDPDDRRDPDEAAREEIAEETGLLSACTLARVGAAFEFEDEDLATRWVVHPYLFDCERRDAETNWESIESEWVHPTEILRRDAVPKLWVSYSRVAPTVEQVATDADHGSAYVSVRALEVLRDCAGATAADRGERNKHTILKQENSFKRNEIDFVSGWPKLVALAERLLDARPSMAAVANRVNRAMAEASEEATADAVERAARRGIERAARADEQAAANAADEIRGATVLTLSRSGTVLDTLPAADRVFVAESRPAREGVGVAEKLATETRGDDRAPAVTLHTDAAVAHVLASEAVDAVVVGADAVLADGRVENKTGTRGAALAASREGIPCYAVAASDKIRTDDEVRLEDGDPEAVYGGEVNDSVGDHGETDIEVLNPTFDVTPADLVDGVITERGVLDAAQVRAVADDLRELAAWRE